jgi:hypothetical protein
MSISSPWYGLLAGVAFVIWLMQRRRRHRVPGSPIIHRGTEQAEREVQQWRAGSCRSTSGTTGAGAPRPPIRL